MIPAEEIVGHQFDPALILSVLGVLPTIVVLGYTVRVSRLFGGLPILQRPWRGMIVAILFFLASTVGTSSRLYFHLGPATPLGPPTGFATGIALLGFIIALAYTLMAFYKAWAPKEVKA